MQVSVEHTSAIQRRLTIGIPSGQVDSEVEKRLQKNAKTIRINGFRPGKVPVSVVRKRYGEGIRQEVVGEAMRDSYMEAIQLEKLNPAGYPEFEPKQVEAGKDIEFTATVEVYPEFQIADLTGFRILKEEPVITDADIDTMIESLRKQSVNWVEKQGPAAKGDKVVVDYRGEVEGEAFAGGAATGANLELGSNSMIAGFEDGVVGMQPGDEKTLSLKFPADYHADALKGKDVEFHVSVTKVEQGKLPEVDEDFFGKYGVNEGGKDAFRAELKKNMEREASFAIANKVKQQIVDQLISANQFEVPTALIKREVDKIKQEAVQRFGIPEGQASQLPDELFSGQAETRVKTGLLFAQMVKENELTATDEQIEAKISEMAASYQDPTEVTNWYMNNPEQKQQIESVVLEEAVVDHIVSVATVETRSVAYEAAIKPASTEPVDESAAE